MTDNLSEDEIIIDSHDDVFNFYQIHLWSKDRISDVLPAIKCSSFKSETKFFKISELHKIGEFIDAQIHTKSIVIENANANKELSINLIYSDTIKITPRTFYTFQQTKFLDKLKERYELWEIDDCTCKPKKIWVWVDDFEKLKNIMKELKRISNINDAQFGVYIKYSMLKKFYYYFHTIYFNSECNRSDLSSKFIFTGDTLAAVSKGSFCNFRLDKRT